MDTSNKITLILFLLSGIICFYLVGIIRVIPESNYRGLRKTYLKPDINDAYRHY